MLREQRDHDKRELRILLSAFDCGGHGRPPRGVLCETNLPVEFYIIPKQRQYSMKNPPKSNDFYPFFSEECLHVTRLFQNGLISENNIVPFRRRYKHSIKSLKHPAMFKKVSLPIALTLATLFCGIASTYALTSSGSSDSGATTVSSGTSSEDSLS